MAELFQSSKSNLSEHIKHIFEEGELEEDSVVRKFRTTAADGKRYLVTHYNLDMIISLGYRVKSKTATQFRKWATERLKEYLIKGFALDDQRLKNFGGGSYWRELLERIRDIRSSEKVMYRQVLDLYATSIDYDPRSAELVAFFRWFKINSITPRMGTRLGISPTIRNSGISPDFERVLGRCAPCDPPRLQPSSFVE